MQPLIAPISATPFPRTSKKDVSDRGNPSLRETLGRIQTSRSEAGIAPATSPRGDVSPKAIGNNAFSGVSSASLFSSSDGVAAATVPPAAATRADGVLSPFTRTQRGNQQSDVDRSDAMWADMQRTLQAVELSASRGTHFFGRGHPAALEELRSAQIELARAWSREREETTGNLERDSGKKGDKNDVDREKDGRKNSSSEETMDETEADMATARRRREASDRYFERVSRHVDEVTERLEDVAVAMGKVEEESREGWSEDESLDSGSVTSGTRV